MKILFYNHTGKVSGAEHLLLMILSRLDRDRFDPVLVCPQPGPLRGKAEKLGVAVETVAGLDARFTWRIDHLARYLKSFYQTVSQVRRQVVSFKPALIHANSIRSGLVATAATVGLGTRVIWQLHDLLPRHPLSTAIRAFAFFSRRTRMIAVSQAVADNFCGSGLPLRRRLSVILNAIDLNEFQPALNVRTETRPALDLHEADFAVGIIGQITPRKGQLELLRAFARVQVELPQAVLVIVGAPLFNQDHKYLELLERTVLKISTASRVRILGPRSDVPAIMQSLDLLVVNSAAEPFGLVAVEAMACGTPVLAAATGGLCEIIEHGKDGWLVPPGDESAMANELVSLSRQPALRSMIAEEGRKKAASHFSSDRYMDQLQNFYLKNVDSTGRKSEVLSIKSRGAINRDPVVSSTRPS